MASVYLIHGVPDTPLIWRPLITALGLPEGTVAAPALPGFGAPRPKGFGATKDEYAAWLVETLEAGVAANGGPVHVLGHDWGAILTARVAMLRPDLFASWATVNGFAGPGRRWHSLARKWQTPVLGEVVMLLMKKQQVAELFTSQGVSPEVAEEEAQEIDWRMKRSILALYRSAKTLADDWPRDFDQLPGKGLLLWGTDDPFAPYSMAQKFCAEQGFPLHTEEGVGHWSYCARPESIAARLKTHWGMAD